MERVVVLVVGLLTGCSGEVVFEQANNYTFSSSIELETVELQPGADVLIDWSAVTTDLRGRAFDGTPDQVALLGCPDSKAELIEALNSNTLTQDSCPTSYLYDTSPGETSANASEFEIVGNPLDPKSEFLDDDRNWLFSLLDTASGRDEALISTFANFVTDATATTVALTDTSTALEYTVSLAGEAIPANVGTVVLDWSAVTTDVFGNDFDPIRGDELLVARFDATDVSEIEDVFLQLDTEAAELYRLTVFGSTTADAQLATDESGNTFQGFTADGIWLVGIGCTSCLNPAPLLLAVVDVR